MDPWPCRVCGKRPHWFGWDRGVFTCHHFDGPGGSATTSGPQPRDQALIEWNGLYGQPSSFPLDHLNA